MLFFPYRALTKSLLISCLLFSQSLYAQSSTTVASSFEDLPAFQSGLWWSSAADGHGLDIQFAENIVFVVLYTYDTDGNPIWYTAQGPLDGADFETDLLYHRWDAEKHQYIDYVADGKIQLTVENPQSISATIEVQGGTSELQLSPFAQSNITQDEPKTGLWFNPQNSGYGFTYVEQQRWRFGLYYYYDEQGKPTWLYGSNEGKGQNIQLLKFSGRCLSCENTTSSNVEAGSATFSFSQQRKGHVSLQLKQNGPWALSNSPIQMLSQAESDRPSYNTLSQFSKDESLASYLREAYLNLSSRYDLDFSPAPPPTSTSSAVSSTNLQELGVDEIDYLKTDGSCAFTFPSETAFNIASHTLDGSGQILSKELIEKSPYKPTEQSDIPSSSYNDLGVYLDNEHLATLSSSYIYHYGKAWEQDELWQGGYSFIDVYEREQCTLKNEQRIGLSGYIVSSRRIGKEVYIVWRSVTQVGYSLRDQQATLKAALEARELPELVPQIKLPGEEWKAVLDHQNTFVLPGKENPASNFMMLTRVNLENPSDAKTIALAGHLETLYVSQKAAYFVSSANAYRTHEPLGFNRYAYSTQIHKVMLDSELNYAGSGSVDGYLDENSELAPFRLSERNDDLAVVTLFSDGDKSRYKLSIITPSTKRPGHLVYKSYLPNPQRPEPLGKIDERLEATRFVDNKMYAVTFRLTDPLYVVNLENHDDPFIEGVLEVPGFSNYLHPLPNNKLLGIGKSANPGGQQEGNQISLFDISDASKPSLLQSLKIGAAGSANAADYSHHGFSYLPQSHSRKARFAIPMMLQSPTSTNFNYQWESSGLFEFEFNDNFSGFEKVGELLTYDRQKANVSHEKQSSALNGRSALFDNRVLYYEGGRLWGANWGDNIPDYVPDNN